LERVASVLLQLRPTVQTETADRRQLLPHLLTSKAAQATQAAVEVPLVDLLEQAEMVFFLVQSPHLAAALLVQPQMQAEQVVSAVVTFRLLVVVVVVVL
jgi:hypothetical protein